MNTSPNEVKASKNNNPTGTMRCAAYVRTGTGDKVDDCTSVAIQKRRLEAYASERGWTICEWYEDIGFSGVTIERPALRQLMAEGKKRCFDRVLVVHMDRLARRVADFLTVVTKLSALSIDVASCTPAFEISTAEERLMCGILATLSECEEKMPIGDEGLERSLTSRESDDPPATRLMESMIRVFLQFQGEHNDQHKARSELSSHNVDLQRRGAQ